MQTILATLIGPVGRVTADPNGRRCAECGKLIYFTKRHAELIASLPVRECKGWAESDLEHFNECVNGGYKFVCQYCSPTEQRIERYEARYEARMKEQDERSD